jgi:hypothetical protein
VRGVYHCRCTIGCWTSEVRSQTQLLPATRRVR